MKSFGVLLSLANVVAFSALAQRTPPEIHPPIHQDVSPPLRNIVPIPPKAGHVVRPYRRIRGTRSFRGTDAVIQQSVGPRVSVTVGINQDGVGEGFTGPQGTFVITGAPSDSNSSVGATQVVEWVNTAFAVFNKTTGATIYGPAAGNTLWSGFTGPCQTDNDGDPIVVYDKAASRWVMSQF